MQLSSLIVFIFSLFIISSCGNETNKKKLIPEPTITLFEHEKFSFTPNQIETFKKVRWTQISGPVARYDYKAPTLSFVVPNVSIDQSAMFQLEVFLENGSTLLETLTLNISAYPSISFDSIDNESLVKCLKSRGVDDIFIYELHCFNLDSLEGIEILEHLVALTVHQAGLRDISAIKELKNLEKLVLSHNSIKDISPITKLTNLIYLDISSNPIGYLGYSLIPLVNLEELYLSDLDTYAVAGMPWLEYLPKLRKLVLNDNSHINFSDINLAPNLTHLEVQGIELDDLVALPYIKHLDISDPYLSSIKYELDLEHLPDFENLEVLNISRRRISGLTYIGRLSKLEELYAREIFGTQQEELDFSPISDLSGLTSLSISNAGLSDISFLKDLSAIQKLDISHNPGVTNISALETLEGLSMLNIAGLDALESLSPLNRLENLYSLDIDGIGELIHDFENLVILPNIEELVVSNNKALHANTWSKLSKVEVLSVSFSELNSISELSNLSYLRKLDMSFNQVQDISPLVGLTRLNKLNMGHNPVVDLSTLKEMDYLYSVELWGDTELDCDDVNTLNTPNIYVLAPFHCAGFVEYDHPLLQ